MSDWPLERIKPGASVRIRTALDRKVAVTDQIEGSPRRPRVVLNFDGDGPEAILFSNLELIEQRRVCEYERSERGLFGGVRHLREEITYRRLSGKLSNLIYSLNTTNTQFLAYQFKPVLQCLDSPDFIRSQNLAAYTVDAWQQCIKKLRIDGVTILELNLPESREFLSIPEYNGRSFPVWGLG